MSVLRVKRQLGDVYGMLRQKRLTIAV